MMGQKDVMLVGGVRTAIGDFGGSLRDKSPTELGSLVAAEALRRSGVDAAEVDHTIFGNVIHTEAKDMYLSRVAAMGAGIPKEVPAMTLNRLCGSGLQAIVSAAQLILLDDADITVAGGAESMSRAGHLLSTARWGQKMGNTVAVDMMTEALHDPFGHGHMGITAENLAEKYQISRNQQDAFAHESHQRAQRAIEEGRFEDQILPVDIKVKRDTAQFDQDEHVRADLELSDMTGLRPAFKKDGTVTAGNASGLNDAAAAVVLMSGEVAEKRGATPLAKIIGYGHAGVEPSEMGIGPVPAVKNMLDRIDMSIEAFDIIESNEAFAAQACAVSQALGLDPEKVNPNGGAIALGHPIGATGTIIALKLVHELQRTGGKFGIATMCIGGGQGIAMAVEAV